MADLFTYVTIDNQSSYSLDNLMVDVAHGYFKDAPPNNIDAQTSAHFYMKDGGMLVAAGSEGTATYDLGDGTVRFSFCCSYSENGNYARVENKGTRVKCELWANNAQYYLETPDGNEGTYPTDGHPLSVYYRITDRPRP